MKTKTFKSLLLALIAAMLPQLASAYDFMVDGIAYNYNNNGTSVTVTWERNPNSSPYNAYPSLSGSINIPESVTYNGTIYSVTSIGFQAFYNCRGLTSVTIPNSVASISYQCFYGCTGLTSVTIPNSVTSIGYRAFYGCSSLTSMTIPNSVTSIGNFAFSSCSGLTSVTIGNSVTSIGGSAFDGCSGLTSVTIPNSVISIGNYAFSGCIGMTTVTLNSNAIVSKNYTESSNISHIFGSQVQNYIIGDEVTSIGDLAFYNCSGLTSLTIGNSVTSIGWKTFYSCSGLTSVTIPNSVTSIGDRAFYNCSGLTSIVVESGNTKYDSRSNCNAIIKTATNTLVFGCMNTVIPNSVTTIWGYAFYGCSGLTSVTIPNSVTSIGDYAFYDCSGLTSVIWNARSCADLSLSTSAPFYNIRGNIQNFTFGEGVEKIPACLCSGMSKLTSLTIPNSVTTIGGSAFDGCIGLTSVTIPNSVTEIGNYAFSSCSGLTTVTLNSNAIVSNNYTSSSNFSNIFGSQVQNYIIGDEVTSIGDFAFYNCGGITSLAIPNSVTSIGNQSFRSCTSLTSASIPDSVKTIGNNAFENCSRLSTVTVGKSVTSFGNNVFSGCNDLTSVEWNAKNCCDFSSSTKPFTSSTNLSIFTFGNEVQKIPANLCNGLNGLTELTIPSSVTSVGYAAFWYCNNLNKVNWNAKKCNDFADSNQPFWSSRNVLNEFTFGDEVENIPARLCNGLNSLKSLSIPHSVKLIGENAFSGCDSLTNLVWNADSCLTNGNMPTSNIEQVTIGNGVEYLPNNFVSGSKITAVSLPSTLKAISNYAFYGCSGLTKVRIPASVSAIGDAAFANCSGMESVSIGTSVESIGNSAFSGCSSLASLTIPSSVATIGSYAFSGCSSLTKVTIPSSLTELGGSAFNECSGLYKIYWNVINHNDYNSDSSPFKGLTNITEFKVGNGVEKIPAYLCEGLSGLTSLILPSSLLSIGEEAFSGCNGLTSVNFPSSMKSIGEQAFYGCSLTSVTIPNSVDSIGINPFNGCSELSSITVESGNSNYDSRDNCNAIIETQSNNLISGCKNTVVPTTVKKIGNYSFAWNTGFTTINIPNSVTSIGYAAFAECTNLNSITIPNSVIDIDTCAFSDCVGLTSVVIPNSVKSIEAGAFQYCSGLSSVSIGNSVELIGTSAFYSCSSLSSISIPSSVLSVGAYAFQGCSGLTTVTWNVKNGNGYSNYRQSPFFALSNIRSFIFGNEVEVIPNNLCYGLSGLTSITLPNSVTSIASNAFYAAWNSSHPLSTLTLTGKGEWNYNSDALYGLSRIMSKFKTVNIGSEITSLSNFGFTPETINCYAAAAPACQEGTFANYNGELHVPLTSTVGYFTSDYWQNFTNMINDLSDKVTLDQTSADLLQDETLQLTATTIPVGSNLIWSSSNSSIATVSDDGVVNVSGFGECDIFATLESNYAAYASCHVNVSVSSMAITLNKDNAILGANQMLTVYPSCTPDVPVELVVTSSDPSVAVARVVNRTNAPAAGLKSFPEKGMALAHFNSMESPFSKAPAYASEKAIVIVGVQNGTATITVTTADGKAEPAVLELRVADVNGDNVVTASDVTELYNYLLNNDETYIATGDVNGDGNITASDVTEIYNILLGN